MKEFEQPTTEPREITINVMPDKATLEAFIRGSYGQNDVVFNVDTGEFEWLNPEEKPKE